MRMGYTLVPAEIIDSMEKMQQYTTLAPESLGQFSLVKFLNANMKESYIRDTVLPISVKRRNAMSKMLERYLPDANTAKPQGAFYFFVDMRADLCTLKLDEEQFASKLLKKKGVAVIPGRFFGEKGIGHVRMTFVSEPEERIVEAIKRISDFVSGE